MKDHMDIIGIILMLLAIVGGIAIGVLSRHEIPYFTETKQEITLVIPTEENYDK